MDNDKRSGQQPIPDDLEQVLNTRQLAALDAILSLGWHLKFVRRPLFMEAVPVVHNATYDQVGILDPDGNIVVDQEINIRTDEPGEDHESSQGETREERRQGTAPIPGNLSSLLNDSQLQALCQIRVFGWELYFVRRAHFQDPVVGIISPEGDRIATLEQDGRINLLADSTVRIEDPGSEPADTDTAGLELEPVAINFR